MIKFILNINMAYIKYLLALSFILATSLSAEITTELDYLFNVQQYQQGEQDHVVKSGNVETECDLKKTLDLTPCNNALGDSECTYLDDATTNTKGCCAYLYLNGYGSGWEYITKGHFCANSTYLTISYGLLTPCLSSGFGYCDSAINLTFGSAILVSLFAIANMLF